MAVKKTYGKIIFNAESRWEITEAKPHVCIKLKACFPKLEKNKSVPFFFRNTPETCADLLWFMIRYPLEVSGEDFNILCDGKVKHEDTINEMEEIFLPTYSPKVTTLNDGFTPRGYQIQASELHRKTKRMVLGDDLGLGKTLSAILTFSAVRTLPALVVVQTHLTKQWEMEIKKFTNLSTHVIKGTQPYSLPSVDVYIITYSRIAGWVDVLTTGFLKSTTFDEVQELRRSDSQKYAAAKNIADEVEYCMGMSATPIYNYGDEIFNILDLIKPGCLGNLFDFLREWATRRGMNYMIEDPKALGTYLRDNYLFLRRTREDVGRELPPINRIVQYVGYDDGEVKKCDQLARQLAMKVIHGSFMERGSAARELDAMVRHTTGVSKAREVAEYVKIILDSGEPVVLAGWHRQVYEIWLKHLDEYNPVLYTGSESTTEKEESKRKFVDGETNLFIISLRSGIGLDGLQKRCKVVVVGELDWSPQVHTQLIGRVDRDGQEDQVTAIFCVSDYGSDPVIMDVLGLKSSQAHAIINPLSAPPPTVSDDSRIKILAQKFLDKNGEK
jgi:superfamily II DNA or RNA helicase